MATLRSLEERFEVLEVKTLGLVNDKAARELLVKTAWQVQPIMKRRRWKARAHAPPRVVPLRCIQVPRIDGAARERSGRPLLTGCRVRQRR